MLNQQLHEAQVKLLFDAYKKLAFKIQLLGGIVQSPMVLSANDMDDWFAEVDARKAELDTLAELTAVTLGFPIPKKK